MACCVEITKVWVLHLASTFDDVKRLAFNTQPVDLLIV